MACSKLIDWQLAAKDKEALHFDNLAYRWLRCGCIIFDDTRIDFWDDLLKNEPKLQLKARSLLASRLTHTPGNIDLQYMHLFFECKNKKTEEEIAVPMGELRRLALEY